MPETIETYSPPRNAPVRFLAMTWDAGWEFDRPTILLEPVQRYSPHDQSPESLIEDVSIDLCVYGQVESKHPFGDEEFHWRHWSWKRFRQVAADCLKGRKFPLRGYRVVETWLEFYDHPVDGLMCRDATAPERSGRMLDRAIHDGETGRMVER